MKIPNVSVCSIGSAKGHGLECDETLLTQLAHEITRKGKVIVKLNHRGGLETVVGWLQNARIKAGRLLGDLELFKSGKDYNFVRELVEKFGNSIGLSPAFTGSAEPLADGKQAARCRELHSVDLVESPASNPTGLFSAEINGSLIAFQSRPAPLTLSAKQSAELRQLRRRVAAVQIRFDALNRRSGRLPNDDDDQNHDGGTSIGHDALAGALEGAGAAVLTDALLHGEGSVAERLASVGRSLKTPIKSGLPKKALIGAASGGLLTAGAGLLVDKLVRQKRQAQEQNRFSRLSPEEERQRSLYRVAGYRHKIGEDELNRAASSYTKAAATGAIAGGLVGSLRGKAKIGAGIGALAGLGSIKAIREALPPDQYGQHSPEEHQIEKAVPWTAAGIAAIAARKKLKQSLGKAAQKAGNLFA